MVRPSSRVARWLGATLVVASVTPWLAGGSIALAGQLGAASDPSCEQLTQPTHEPGATPSLASSVTSAQVIISVTILPAGCGDAEPTPTGEPRATPSPVPTPTSPLPTPTTDVLGEKLGPDQSSPPGKGGKLPFTGSSLSLALGLSLALMVAGVAILVGAGRTAATSSSERPRFRHGRR